MEPWAQFHSDLTLEDVLAEVSIPEDGGDGSVAASERQLTHVQNLALAEQVSLDAHLLLHKDLPLPTEDESSLKSESNVLHWRTPVTRSSYVDIQLNNELLASACSLCPEPCETGSATPMRPSNPEPMSPSPCLIHRANNYCHIHEANGQVMACGWVNAVEEAGEFASEAPTPACSGARSPLPHTSADTDIDNEMLASGRIPSKEAKSDQHLPTRAPNPEPWKPSELASGLHVTGSQENLDADLSAAMLRAESRAAEQSNVTLVPAVARPENPEPWLPSKSSARLLDGLDDHQTRSSTKDAAADVGGDVEANAAQEQLHGNVMSLLRCAQENELQHRKHDLDCERALAIARAVAGREQHIKVLHAKIAALNRNVAEREEAASRLESALHASRQQADDLTTYSEVIRRHLASLEMHCCSQPKGCQEMPLATLCHSLPVGIKTADPILPLETSFKSATSEQSTACTAQELNLRVALLPETASESLSMCGGTLPETELMLQGLVYVGSPRMQRAGGTSSHICVVEGRFDNSLDQAAQQQEASLLAV